jgi:hypothetical protein
LLANPAARASGAGVLQRATGVAATAAPRMRMGLRVLDLENRVPVDQADGRSEALTASEYAIANALRDNAGPPENEQVGVDMSARFLLGAVEHAKA